PPGRARAAVRGPLGAGPAGRGGAARPRPARLAGPTGPGQDPRTPPGPTEGWTRAAVPGKLTGGPHPPSTRRRPAMTRIDRRQALLTGAPVGVKATAPYARWVGTATPCGLAGVQGMLGSQREHRVHRADRRTFGRPKGSAGAGRCGGAGVRDFAWLGPPGGYPAGVLVGGAAALVCRGPR